MLRMELKRKEEKGGRSEEGGGGWEIRTKQNNTKQFHTISKTKLYTSYLGFFWGGGRGGTNRGFFILKREPIIHYYPWSKAACCWERR